MSDASLMNFDHVKKEIHNLENVLVPEHKQLADEAHEDIRRVTSYFTDTQNRGEDTTLTKEQVLDVLMTLGKLDMNRWRYYHAEEFAIRVYRKLLKDRRWYIGSKFRFLR